jgi:hypothetical protein
VIAYAVVDDALSPNSLSVLNSRSSSAAKTPSGSSRRRDDPEVAAKVRIEERELDAGGTVTSANDQGSERRARRGHVPFIA